MAFDVEGVEYVLAAKDNTSSAFRTAQTGMERLQKSYESLVRTLGITVSIGAFIGLVKGAIDAMDHLNDLHKATGVTIEDLSGLRLLARQTGTDLDSLAKGFGRMSVEMGKDPEKFRRLGITAKDGVGAFKEFADIFNQLPDINQRNALSQAVFNKSWQELAPALSEGSAKIGEAIEKGARLSKVTKEMAEKADELNDKWAELVGTGGLLNSMVGKMLGPLISLTNQMIAARDASDGFWGKVFGFATLSGDQAKDPQAALDGINKKLLDLRRTQESFGNMGFFKRLLLNDDIGILATQIAYLEKQRDVLNRLVTPDYGNEGRRAGASADRVAVNGKSASDRAADFLREKDAAGEADSAYRNLLKTLKEKSLIEIEATEVKKLQITLDAMSEKQLATITPARRAELQALAEKIDLNKRNIELQKIWAKQYEATAALEQEIEEHISKQRSERDAAITTTQKAIEQLEFETTLIGLNNTERETAIALRTMETSGIDRQSIAYASLAERMKAAIAANNVAKEAAELKKKTLDEFNSLWSTVEHTGKEVFINLFSGGKSAFEGIGKAIKASVIDLLYQLTARKWIINIGTSIAGSMGITSAASASGGLGGIGSGLSAASSANSAMGFLGGSQAIADFGNFFGSVGATTEMGTTFGMMDAIGGFAAANPLVAAGLVLGAATLGGLFDSGPDGSAPAGPPGIYNVGLNGGVAGPHYSYQGARVDGGQYSGGGEADVSAINTQIAAMVKNMRDAGVAAGLSSSAFDDLNLRVDATGSSIEDAFGKALNQLGDSIAKQVVPNIVAMQQAGETLAQTYARVTAAQTAATAALAAQRRAMDIHLLELQGNAVGALAARREDELKAMDASLKSLQQLVYGWQDYADAQKKAQDAVSAALSTAQDTAKVFGQISIDLTAQIAKLGGGSAPVLLTALQGAFQKALKGDVGALQSLPGLSDNYLAAAQASSSTAADFARKQAQVVTMLEQANGVAIDTVSEAERQVSILQTVHDELQKQTVDMGVIGANIGRVAGFSAATASLLQSLVDISAKNDALSAQAAQDAASAKAAQNPLTAAPAAGTFNADLWSQIWHSFTDPTGRYIDASSPEYSDFLAKTQAIYNATPGHAMGLDYVPYDNYLFRAHTAEAVLTAPEAAQWRNGGAANDELVTEIRALRTEVAALRQSAAITANSTKRQLDIVQSVYDPETQSTRTVAA